MNVPDGDTAVGCILAALDMHYRLVHLLFYYRIFEIIVILTYKYIGFNCNASNDLNEFVRDRVAYFVCLSHTTNMVITKIF